MYKDIFIFILTLLYIYQQTNAIRFEKRRTYMKLLKRIFTNIDIHLNAKAKTLTIIYGENKLLLKLTEDGKVRLDTNLVLEGPSEKNITNK